jgi:hypothetical protein
VRDPRKGKALLVVDYIDKQRIAVFLRRAMWKTMIVTAQ